MKKNVLVPGNEKIKDWVAEISYPTGSQLSTLEKGHPMGDQSERHQNSAQWVGNR